jgi:hypothetical protein
MPIVPYGQYSYFFNGEVIAAQRDLFEITAPSDAIVTIDSLFWRQYNASPPDEILKINLRRYSGAFNSGSGGTTLTAQKMCQGMAAAGSTCEDNNTTQATVGSGVVEHEIPLTVNHRDRERTWLFHDEPIILSPGQTFIWSLNTSPAAVSLNLNASVRITEYGG